MHLSQQTIALIQNNLGELDHETIWLARDLLAELTKECPDLFGTAPTCSIIPKLPGHGRLCWVLWEAIAEFNSGMIEQLKSDAGTNPGLITKYLGD